MERAPSSTPAGYPPQRGRSFRPDATAAPATMHSNEKAGLTPGLSSIHAAAAYLDEAALRPVATGEAATASLAA